MNKVWKHKHEKGLFIDYLAYTSRIRSWNSTYKVLFSILILILCITLDNPYVSVGILIGMMYITVIKGNLSVQHYLAIQRMPLIFILISTVTIGIDFAKQPIGQYNIKIIFGYIFTSWIQLQMMFLLLLKVFAAWSVLQMLIVSTPSNEIISVLRKLHVPKLIIELMYLIYRFIFILLNVYKQMKQSAEARLGYCDFKRSYYTFGNIVSNMLILSLKKADAYYDAMEARGYDGELRFLEEDKKISKIQIAGAMVYIFILILLWYFTR